MTMIPPTTNLPQPRFGTAILATLLLVAVAMASGLGEAVAAQPAPEETVAPRPLAWVTPAVTSPGVSFHTFESAAAKATVSYHVFTPAAYGRDSEERFPVVYWLHGSGGGPLQADLRDAPRVGRRRAADVLERVYGGDPEYFRSVSPRRLAEQHVDALRNGAIIRQVCGDEDETFAANRDFHEHLERLGIPHAWIVLPGVDHDPLATLAALGDSNWAFYRQALGPAP